MGIRGTKACTIIKKEIENGSVKVVYYKDFIEYWCYDTNKSGTLDAQTGVYTTTSAEVKTEVLRCIVVSENNPEHIVKDLPTHLLVKGAIFNDVEYPDMFDYLAKTERVPNKI